MSFSRKIMQSAAFNETFIRMEIKVKRYFLRVMRFVPVMLFVVLLFVDVRQSSESFIASVNML